MVENWGLIQDNRVRHVWKCDCKKAKKITVDPSFYADAGTPVCEECGEDLSYVRTEILEDKDPRDLKKVLREFIGDIDATGGVCKFEDTDDYAPVGDKDWIDLGETYLKACKALRRRPHIVKEDA